MKGFQLKKSPPWSWVTWVLRISRAVGSLDKYICLIWTNIHFQSGQIYMFNLDKYILVWLTHLCGSGASHVLQAPWAVYLDLVYIRLIWTNIFCDLDKYILQFGQIHTCATHSRGSWGSHVVQAPWAICSFSEGMLNILFITFTALIWELEISTRKRYILILQKEEFCTLNNYIMWLDA